MYDGSYSFFVGDLELPYAPSKLKVTIGSNNQTVDLINGNSINILKNPKLTEIEFDVELPRGRQYPFANKIIPTKTYLDYFEKLMLDKTPTTLVITRPAQFHNVYNNFSDVFTDFSHTELKVSLEGYTLEENAENAWDIIVSLKFKEYLSYGTVKQTVVNNNSGSGGNNKNVSVETETKVVNKNQTYTVVSGDNLSKISKKFYGVTSKWKTIYSANVDVIEATARKYGRSSSSNGHWIYPGTKLIIPSDNT